MAKPRITQTVPRDSPGNLVFWRQQLFMGDDPYPMKLVLKVTHPFLNTTFSTMETTCSKNLYLPIV